MTELTLVQAVNRGLQVAMRGDPDVLVLGEDVGVNGGVFRATEGLLKEFGEERVLDTPLSETGIIGTAVGMALYGLKPVAEIQFLDFIYPAFDQIVSELAKFRYRSGGPVPLPCRDPDTVRRRHQGRTVPFPEHRGLLLPHRGLEGRYPLDPGGREGVAPDGDPRPRSRDVLGAEAHLPIGHRRSTRRRRTHPLWKGATGPRLVGCLPLRLRGDDPGRERGGGAARLRGNLGRGRRPPHVGPPGRSGRSRLRREDRAEPSSSTKPPGSAGSAPSSPPSSPRRRSTH